MGKLDEPELVSISNEDAKKMVGLLKFIAQGGLYAVFLAILGIGVASLYAGWMGMAIIMLLFGFVLFWFESKKLMGILNPREAKIRIARKEMLWPVGLLFLALALMGLIDRTVGNLIPRPPLYPYWVLVVEGGVGAVLLIIAVSLWVNAKRK